ncbi:vanadium-dependent haloperoxidase [Streptomyces sp. NPDC057877]|uniref:vanadium-dependent haloperoxidase n=1 Tax=Streptomyces sp. NPDC057877 TaxID=3346269 RepID=UPI0036A7F835
MDTRPPSRPLRRTLVVGLTGLALAAVPCAPTAAAPGERTTGTDVITDWNRTTEAVLNDDAKLYSAEQFVWHGFVSTAVYNAVVGIEGWYKPYKWRVRAPRHASPEAAAAAAAHRVLLTYFPTSRQRIDTAYRDSLAGIADGTAEKRGVAFGERAARHLIGLRADDGRDSQVTYDRPPATGVWRPTPPTHTPFALAWLTRTRPLLLDSAQRMLPEAPPAVTSRRYAADLAEVRALGAKNSTRRTARQTETARFFADVLPKQFQAAYRGWAARHGLDLVETARLLAAANTATADATIAAWYAKFTHAQWRPITAIRLADGDGNPATEGDPAWEPLLRTPAYPDYVSGHCAVDGAAVTVLDRFRERFTDGDDLDLRISSAVTGTTRTYHRAADFNRDVIDARTLGGVHFRTSDIVGNRMGRQIGGLAMDEYFVPLG